MHIVQEPVVGKSKLFAIIYVLICLADDRPAIRTAWSLAREKFMHTKVIYINFSTHSSTVACPRLYNLPRATGTNNEKCTQNHKCSVWAQNMATSKLYPNEPASER
jgi:hypothetical protein